MLKKAVMFLILFGSAVSAGNFAWADQLQSILSCTKITEDAKRLACFDSASKKMIDSGAGVLEVKKAKPTKEEQVADFGKKQLRKSPVKEIREKQQKEEEQVLKEIKLTVVEIAYTTIKKFVLFMENDQIWKQKDGGKIWFPKGRFEVEIKKGLFGGYKMKIPNKKGYIDVIRLK